MTSRPVARQSGSLSRPPQHRVYVGESNVRDSEFQGIAALLGEFENPPEMSEPLLGAAKVDEVTSKDVRAPGTPPGGRRLH